MSMFSNAPVISERACSALNTAAYCFLSFYAAAFSPAIGRLLSCGFACAGVSSAPGLPSLAQHPSALPTLGPGLAGNRLAELFPINVGSLLNDVPMEASSVKRKRVRGGPATSHSRSASYRLARFSSNDRIRHAWQTARKRVAAMPLILRFTLADSVTFVG